MRVRARIVLGQSDSHETLSIRRLLSSGPGLIFVGFSISFLLAFRYYAYANYRDPTSYFFDPVRAFERVYSSERIREADAFIEAASQLPSPAASHTPPTMCVGVATVARRGEQYVRETIGSLLAGLNDDERRSIYLNLLIGHTDPAKHPISQEKWIETLPNKVLHYGSHNATELARLRAWEDGGWYRNKSIYDYTFLLQDCYASGAPYIAMIEDDTLAVEGWYPRVLHALEDIEATMQRRHGAEWLYLRIFYQEELLGWNSESWARYLFWSGTVWAGTTLLMIGTRNRSRWLQSHLSGPAMVTLSCVCLPLFILLHFLAGRHSMWPLSAGVHEMNKYGCCSQGYIFPRDMVPAFLARTDLHTDWLVDMMVETIADREGWARWVVVPALLQHIGSTSSKGHGFDDNAKSIWNFGFEMHGREGY